MRYALLFVIVDDGFLFYCGSGECFVCFTSDSLTLNFIYLIFSWHLHVVFAVAFHGSFLSFMFVRRCLLEFFDGWLFFITLLIMKKLRIWPNTDLLILIFASDEWHLCGRKSSPDPEHLFSSAFLLVGRFTLHCNFCPFWHFNPYWLSMKVHCPIAWCHIFSVIIQFCLFIF